MGKKIAHSNHDASDPNADFVEHPRYGRGPRLTGLNPQPNDRGVNLHRNATTLAEVIQGYEQVVGPWPYGDLGGYTNPSTRIPHTAIEADLRKQAPATVAVTHYYDVESVCRDCRRPFIFFAAEQKYWYEDLGFKLEYGCVRCIDCRQRQQRISRQRREYESLFHTEGKTVEQTLQMATLCLALIESRVFSRKSTAKVRQLLNAVPDGHPALNVEAYAELQRRLDAIAAEG